MNSFLTKLINYLSNPPAFLRNKYALTIIAFGIFISVFDKNSIVKHYHLSNRIQEAEEMRDQYKEDIAVLKSQRQALLTNEKSLEKFGREEYFMKRDNEEIILFVDKPKAATPAQ